MAEAAASPTQGLVMDIACGGRSRGEDAGGGSVTGESDRADGGERM